MPFYPKKWVLRPDLDLIEHVALTDPRLWEFLKKIYYQTPEEIASIAISAISDDETAGELAPGGG